MKKAEFVELVADKAEMSRSSAARAVDAIFNTATGAISEAVGAAGHLSIPGFGKFTRRTRAARVGRNPRTGAVIDIPERTSISFTPGRGLRNLAAAEKGDGTRTAKKSAGGKRRAAAAKGGKKATGKRAGTARAQKSK